MHDSVMAFCARAVDRYGLAAAGAVLEIGSRDLNGTTRPLFPEAGSYVGVDMLPGPSVDLVVVAGEPLPFPSDAFTVVVSTETLEHDPAPWLTVAEAGRVLQPGGILLLTARGIHCDLHPNPDDFWRFTQSGFRRLLDLAGLAVLELEDDPQDPGVLAVARKPSA